MLRCSQDSVRFSAGWRMRGRSWRRSRCSSGGFLLTLYSMTDPDSIVSTVGSFIPFFTPMVMFARIELGDPALWEIFLGVGLLIDATALSI